MTEYYVILVLFFLYAFFSNYIKGWIGEKLVELHLRKLDIEKYVVLHNLLVKKEDGSTSQIDHVVFSVFGIFVIETKNYKGWIYGDEKSFKWTQTIYKHKSKFLNPIIQNKGHIKALKELIGDEIPFFSIIAFTPRATLKVKNTETPVIYTSQLKKYLKKHSEEVVDIEIIRETAASILGQNINNFSNLRTHVKDIKEKQNAVKIKTTDETLTKTLIVPSAVSERICPSCQKPMLKRKGKYGEFWGCSGYPECKEKVSV